MFIHKIGLSLMPPCIGGDCAAAQARAMLEGNWLNRGRNPKKPLSSHPPTNTIPDPHCCCKRN
jgi:hypothetical protein